MLGYHFKNVKSTWDFVGNAFDVQIVVNYGVKIGYFLLLQVCACI
jgi:hypothetical protein